MFGRLLPQEGRFFDLFNDHAEQIVLGAHQLVALMEDLSVAEQHIAAIETIEQAADKITHETVAQAHKSFITPLDRDEIHSLINAMDDILDTVQDVAECITLYHIQRITPCEGGVHLARGHGGGQDPGGPSVARVSGDLRGAGICDGGRSKPNKSGQICTIFGNRTRRKRAGLVNTSAGPSRFYGQSFAPAQIARPTTRRLAATSAVRCCSR